MSIARHKATYDKLSDRMVAEHVRKTQNLEVAFVTSLFSFINMYVTILLSIFLCNSTSQFTFIEQVLRYSQPTFIVVSTFCSYSTCKVRDFFFVEN